MCRCTGYVKIVEAVEAAARGDVEHAPRLPEAEPESPRSRRREPGMKAVGARLPRYDGLAQVTGRHHLRRRRPRPGHALDEGAALAAPLRGHHEARHEQGRGASRASTRSSRSDDVPLNVYGHLSGLGVPGDEPLLAEDEVRYKGQPIAAVAAETEEIAQARRRG